MKFEFSAGGVVLKREHTTWFVLLVKHARHGHWAFPKGHIGDSIEGESKEAAAVREVKEETGIDAIIIQPLTPILYWYVMNGEKRKKTVYYYIMQSNGGDFSQKDHEMEQVEWVSLDHAAQQLTFDGERKALQEAKIEIPVLEKRIEFQA